MAKPFHELQSKLLHLFQRFCDPLKRSFVALTLQILPPLTASLLLSPQKNSLWPYKYKPNNIQFSSISMGHSHTFVVIRLSPTISSKTSGNVNMSSVCEKLALE